MGNIQVKSSFGSRTSKEMLLNHDPSHAQKE
jgi:hypothetical protein